MHQTTILPTTPHLTSVYVLRATTERSPGADADPRDAAPRHVPEPHHRHEVLPGVPLPAGLQRRAGNDSAAVGPLRAVVVGRRHDQPLLHVARERAPVQAGRRGLLQGHLPRGRQVAERRVHAGLRDRAARGLSAAVHTERRCCCGQVSVERERESEG